MHEESPVHGLDTPAPSLRAWSSTTRDEAMQAFCLSTDATGVAIQPGPLPKDQGDVSRPCQKGHLFIVLADRDHVFFEYQPKHTSRAVADLFKGFSGYLQADAHAVYGALFRRAPDPADPEDTWPPTEVGYWAHARRSAPGASRLGELLQPLGHITVPQALMPGAEEKPVS